LPAKRIDKSAGGIFGSSNREIVTQSREHLGALLRHPPTLRRIRQQSLQSARIGQCQ